MNAIAVNPWKNRRASGWKIFCDAKCATLWGATKHLHEEVYNYNGATCDQCKTTLMENQNEKC
jgi:hypothetical protein